MERAEGIGGVFFKAADADALSGWYLEVYPNGRFAQVTDPEGNAVQLWEPA